MNSKALAGASRCPRKIQVCREVGVQLDKMCDRIHYDVVKVLRSDERAKGKKHGGTGWETNRRAPTSADCRGKGWTNRPRVPVRALGKHLGTRARARDLLSPLGSRHTLKA